MLYSDYPTARLHLSTLVQGGQCLSGARASLVPTEECFSCYITCRASRPTSLKITPLPITARRVCAAGALLVISSNSGMSHFMTSLGQARESVVVTMRTTVTDCNRTLVQRRMKLMIFRRQARRCTLRHVPPQPRRSWAMSSRKRTAGTSSKQFL